MGLRHADVAVYPDHLHHTVCRYDCVNATPQHTFVFSSVALRHRDRSPCAESLLSHTLMAERRYTVPFLFRIIAERTAVGFVGDHAGDVYLFPEYN